MPVSVLIECGQENTTLNILEPSRRWKYAKLLQNQVVNSLKEVIHMAILIDMDGIRNE